MRLLLVVKPGPRKPQPDPEANTIRQNLSRPRALDMIFIAPGNEVVISRDCGRGEKGQGALCNPVSEDLS